MSGARNPLSASRHALLLTRSLIFQTGMPPFIIAFLVATCALATPLQPTFSSCLSSYPPVAPASSQLDITNIYANLVPGTQASQLGLVGGGHDVLRVDLIGTTGAEVLGYDNGTNKLGQRWHRYRDELLTPCSDALHDNRYGQLQCLLLHFMALQLPVPVDIT